MGAEKPGLASRVWEFLVFFLKTHRKATFVGIVVVLGVILLFQNTHPVRTNLFFWSLQLPLVVWALIFVAIGYFVCVGHGWARQRRLKRLRGEGARSTTGRAGAERTQDTDEGDRKG